MIFMSHGNNFIHYLLTKINIMELGAVIVLLLAGFIIGFAVAGAYGKE